MVWGGRRPSGRADRDHDRSRRGGSELVAPGTPPVTDSSGGPTFQVLLGTFQFTVPGNAAVGEVTHLRATDFDPSLADTTIYDGSPFGMAVDASIVDGFATITIDAGSQNAVPEPASVTMMGLGGAALLLHRRRRGGNLDSAR